MARTTYSTNPRATLARHLGIRTEQEDDLYTFYLIFRRSWGDDEEMFHKDWSLISIEHDWPERYLRPPYRSPTVPVQIDTPAQRRRTFLRMLTDQLYGELMEKHEEGDDFRDDSSFSIDLLEGAIGPPKNPLGVSRRGDWAEHLWPDAHPVARQFDESYYLAGTVTIRVPQDVPRTYETLWKWFIDTFAQLYGNPPVELSYASGSFTRVIATGPGLPTEEEHDQRIAIAEALGTPHHNPQPWSDLTEVGAWDTWMRIEEQELATQPG